MSDLRLAIRVLRKRWSSSLFAVVSLAIAIAANAALLGLINIILFRPLPVRDPARLVTFSYSSPSAADLSSFSLPMYRRLRAAHGEFEDIAARLALSLSVSADGITERAAGEIVTEDFFTMFGIHPSAGRVFDEGSDAGAAVAVLSDAYWKRRFNGRPSVLGKTLIVNGQPAIIIGVTPPEFDGVDPGMPPDFRVPMSMHPHLLPWDATDNERQRSFELFGRRALGVTVERARSAARAVYRNSPLPRYAEETLHVDDASHGRSQLRKRYAAPLLTLEGLALLLLCLAVANVSNLLLANAAARRKEIAVRFALGCGAGASPGSSWSRAFCLPCRRGLWNVACFVGWKPSACATAAWRCERLRAFLAYWRSSGAAVADRPDRRLSHCACSRQAGLEDRDRYRNAQWNRGAPGLSKIAAALVSIQVALSLCLLSGAGLFVRTLQSLKSVDAGFDIDHILLVPLAPAKRDTLALSRLYAEIGRRAASLPGVQSVALANLGLLTGTAWTFSVWPVGASPVDSNAAADPSWRADGDAVSAGFFRTVGTPILAGREFDDRDQRDSTPVIILNEAAARFYFPRGGAVGSRLHATGPADIYQVIGVVKNLRASDLRLAPPKQIFFCTAQQVLNPAMTLHVRAMTDPASLAAEMRETIRQLAPDTAIYGIKTIERRGATSSSSASACWRPWAHSLDLPPPCSPGWDYSACW